MRQPSRRAAVSIDVTANANDPGPETPGLLGSNAEVHRAVDCVAPHALVASHGMTTTPAASLAAGPAQER